MGSTNYHFKVGRFSCLIIKDGGESRPLLSDYTTSLPKELEGHRIYMLGGLMYVERKGSRILIDAGNEPADRDRTHGASTTLQEQGIVSQSIDTVLITHGDSDHIGGLLTEEYELVYPNARYVLHQELWDAWHTDPDQGLYFPTQEPFVRRLAELLVDRVDTFRTSTDVAESVRAIPALGHRCGHTVYLLDSMGEKLYHIGDAAFDPVFLAYPNLPNAHDTQPEEACATRRTLAERAIAENAMIVGSHFHLPGVGRLRQLAKERYEWSPVFPDSPK